MCYRQILLVFLHLKMCGFSPSLLNNRFSGCWVLVWQVCFIFSFCFVCTWKIFCFLLDSMVSDEKYVVIWAVFPLSKVSFPFGYFQDFFPVVIRVWLWHIFVCVVWFFSTSWIYSFMSFDKFGIFSANISLNTFTSSIIVFSWNSNDTNVKFLLLTSI